VSVNVSEATYDLGYGVANFVRATKNALDDGWQMGDDLPVVMTAALQHLVPAIQNIGDLSDEYQNEKAEFLAAVALSISGIAGSFV